MVRSVFSLLIAVFAVLPICGQKELSPIAGIDSYTKIIDQFVKGRKEPHVVVAEVSEYGHKTPKWQKFSSTAALEKYRADEEIYNIAYNWRRNGKIVHSTVTLSSPSGDWAKFLYLYFREDGTIAKSESVLSTFHGDFVARQNFYFDRNGKLVKKTIKYSDLKSGKPRKIDRAELDDNLHFIREDNYFKTTSKLPFARLVRD
jgi:hypothetical protein